MNYLKKCIECGAAYFTEGERDFYNRKGLDMPKRCKLCRDKKKARFKQIQQEKERVELKKHSLSSVDWDYFGKVISVNKNKKNIEWFDVVKQNCNTNT